MNLSNISKNYWPVLSLIFLRVFCFWDLTITVTNFSLLLVNSQKFKNLYSWKFISYFATHKIAAKEATGHCQKEEGAQYYYQHHSATKEDRKECADQTRGIYACARRDHERRQAEARGGPPRFRHDHTNQRDREDPLSILFARDERPRCSSQLGQHELEQHAHERQKADE